MYDCMASAEKVWGMPPPPLAPPPHKKEKKDSFGYGCSMLGSGDVSVYIEKWQMNFCPLFFLERKRCDGFDFFPWEF